MRFLAPRVAPLDLRSVRPPPKEVDPSYLTPEHEAWRDAVIKRASGICEHKNCGRKEHRMFADHITEVRDGGKRHDVANGQCLCGRHHSLKTARERAKRMGAALPG